MRPTAEQIMRALNLEPLPVEGGYFRQTYVAAESVARSALAPRYLGDKPFTTAIYYLLTPDTFSALHRLPTDEVYHFYLGDRVELVELHADGRSSVTYMGSKILEDEVVQHVARAGSWQGSRVVAGGQWALLGTSMSPGYTQEDFELGERQALIAAYPQMREMITALTRVES